MAKRIVTTRDSDGLVMSQWSGGDEQSLGPVAGRTHRTLADGNTADYSGQRWNGTAFESIPAATARTLSAVDFARRFSMAEEIGIDALADTDRTVKAWMRRLHLVTTVDLDHSDVVNGLAYVKSVGIPSVWPDAATADTRIAAILA